MRWFNVNEKLPPILTEIRVRDEHGRVKKGIYNPEDVENQFKIIGSDKSFTEFWDQE